ncbi:MAG: hypothetical protein LUD77_06635 [Clostridiales bacterium]|nr:hypothetical protein [Clostridiales bacterium]
MKNPPNEYAVFAVKNYISAIDEIGIFYGYSFEEISYSKWAAKELLDILEKRKDLPPLIVMEEFQRNMERRSQSNPYTS